jgi:N utilization substance protein A
MVTVPDEQLAMAIGREGQNIRLATALTGWEIKVESETQRAEAGRKEKEAAIQELIKIDGLGLKYAEMLITMGITTVEQLAAQDESVLQSLEGIGEKTAQKILAGAKQYVEAAKAESEKTETEAEVENNAEEGK